MKLLAESGGQTSIGALAEQLGLDGADAGKLVEAVAPALLRGVQKQTERPASMAGLTKALSDGNHQKYLDSPELITDEAARADGNKILGHLFGSKEVSRNVAAQAAQSTGIDSALVKQALPILAGLAMGALSKKGQASDGGTDSGLLGGLLGNMLNGGRDGGPDLDDLFGMARKLF
jgi:hypothetical protein